MNATPAEAGRQAGAVAPRPRRRRHDPERRDRIVEACLDVLAEHGVAGTSHRRVAAAADVPLGSTTYHFAGMDDLLHAAFGRFAERAAAAFERRMAGARDTAEARDAVVRLITQDVFATQRDLVLTHELYTLAAREPAFRTLTNAWMRRSRRALERHFDPATARVLDAYIEGATIHRALDTVPADDADVRVAVARLTGGDA
ncbi:TetR/AcrR family transcriptional regulator [Isoptericola aurantiacus]|uniref:TetR/AcrR family transcriptional regulator n=1 Tax=Isoptericola aurantiacus TaxID=3377839 RepID=UPI00383B1B55